MKNMNPGGLKGKARLDKMRSLMSKAPINEGTTISSKVELTKKGPDNKVYAIVRENQEYYVKVSDKTENLQLEDFNYIGGLQNKKELAFESYAKAQRKLNLKMISLNEQYEGDKVNVFENDNLLKSKLVNETVEEIDFVEEDVVDEDCENEGEELAEGELKVKAVNDGPKELDGNSTGDYEEVTDEPDKAPNDKSTGTEKEGAETATPKKTVKENKKPKYSILKAMERMDSIVESLSKKKV